MNRNYYIEAAVLKTRRFGDSHKIVMMLSPEHGIIEAVAHGAYKGKSRLSSITDPFCVSKFDLYQNPVKNTWKINNAESVKINQYIRDNINALYNASFWAEVIIKSHASGADFENVYSLYTGVLESLDADNKSALALSIQFLYRFIYGSGFITDLSECGHCGSETHSGNVYFSQYEGCFLCERCASSDLPFLDFNSRKYLEETLSINLEEAVKKRLDLDTGIKVRNTLVQIIKTIIESPLKTLDYLDYGME